MDKAQHWVRKDWPVRENIALGGHNIIHEPLVEKNKIILPLVHIKMGLIKQLIQAIDKDGKCFKNIRKIFPGLSNKAEIWDISWSSNEAIDQSCDLCRFNNLF